MKLSIPLKILPHGQGLPLPLYATPDSAGADLYAAVPEDIILKPLERGIIPCGFSMALPPNFEAQIRSRSGLSANHGVVVLNAPGTIDADYRGEIKAVMINMGSEPFTISRGMRVAQMVIAPVTQATWNLDWKEHYDAIHRGGGFGSTGI